MANKSDNKPVHKIRSGALSVSIWEHAGKKAFYSANVQRAYTQDDGKTWHHTDSLTRDDMPVAASLFTQSHAWICRKESEAAKS